MLLLCPFATNDLRTFLLAGLTGCVVHCGAGCRFALRVSRPLKEGKQKKDTRK
jgi:O-antigen ligase